MQQLMSDRAEAAQKRVKQQSRITRKQAAKQLNISRTTLLVWEDELKNHVPDFFHFWKQKNARILLGLPPIEGLSLYEYRVFEKLKKIRSTAWGDKLQTTIANNASEFSAKVIIEELKNGKTYS